MAVLQQHPEGIDDDILAETAVLKQRQQANSRCRQLEKEGLVVRRRVRGKIRNFWIDSKQIAPLQTPLSQDPQPPKRVGAKSWFWEGNVQAAVVRYLAIQGYNIRSVADTASRQPGKDIIAERSGLQLWITVKGYPRGTSKTPASTQAGHWFKSAIFDIIVYRGQSDVAQLGMALPDFPRYRSLTKKSGWFQSAATFSYYWVSKNGEISIESIGFLQHRKTKAT
ncbi:MAG TPA: MarR family transcriptional regulator [Planctomycetes bacterium]|nr:MarR family transcriptional regulator [Planctomycetota bacterium]